MKIAYLGPEGSYSHLAAKEFLNSETGGEHWADECVPFRNFPEVLAAVESERVDAAAIPIENSIQGGVSQNLAELKAWKRKIPHLRVRRVFQHGLYRFGIQFHCRVFLPNHLQDGIGDHFFDGKHVFLLCKCKNIRKL